MFETIRAFKKKGVLAINKRNADYTLKYNPRRLYPLVDDKLRKQLAQANGIACPDLYAVVEVADRSTLYRKNSRSIRFWIKPAQGSGGEGFCCADRRNGA
jgi:hypothetical protein